MTPHFLLYVGPRAVSLYMQLRNFPAVLLDRIFIRPVARMGSYLRHTYYIEGNVWVYEYEWIRHPRKDDYYTAQEPWRHA